jgi:hypothetical protein
MGVALVATGLLVLALRCLVAARGGLAADGSVRLKFVPSSTGGAAASTGPETPSSGPVPSVCVVLSRESIGRASLTPRSPKAPNAH